MYRVFVEDFYKNLIDRQMSSKTTDCDKTIRLVLKKSTDERFRDVLSQVGCIMHDADKVEIVQELLLQNLILRSHIRERSNNRYNKCMLAVECLDKLKTRFSDFETRCAGISILFVLVKEQIKEKIYDEERLALLCHLLDSVKMLVKEFWKLLPSLMEESVCQN